MSIDKTPYSNAPHLQLPVQPQVTPTLKYAGVKHVESSLEIEAKYLVRTSKELVDVVTALDRMPSDVMTVRHDQKLGKKLARYRVVTVYYDTHDLRLRAEGYVVRFRFKNAKHGYDNHFSVKYRDARYADKVADQITCRPEVDISLKEDEPELDLQNFSQVPDALLREGLLAITQRRQLVPHFLTDVTRSKFDLDVPVTLQGVAYQVHMEFAADECFYYALRPDQKLFPLYPHEKFEGPAHSSQIIVGDIKYGKVNGRFLNYEPQFEIEIKGAARDGRSFDLTDDELKYGLARAATVHIIAYLHSTCEGISIAENFQNKADSGFGYLRM